MKALEILKKYNILPKKSFWQNFLINDDILEKIASFLDLKGKNIVEVWPWYWALTEKLFSKEILNLDLVELDKKMIEILGLRVQSWEFKTCENIKLNIKNLDVLKYNPEFEKYLVIANIPYYITSPILFHFLYEVTNKPTEMIILMQKDVADKIRKINGNKTSVLSLYIDYKCSLIKEITKVWPNNFIPPPKVESSVLYFKLKEDNNSLNDKAFLDLIKLWFSERRKKLISNLSKRYDKEKITNIFQNLWFDQNIRAEELSVEDWVKMVENIHM